MFRNGVLGISKYCRQVNQQMVSTLILTILLIDQLLLHATLHAQNLGHHQIVVLALMDLPARVIHQRIAEMQKQCVLMLIVMVSY